MLGWVLIVVGLLVAGYAAIFGVISPEITLALVIVGLLDAATGVFLVWRERRRPI